MSDVADDAVVRLMIADYAAAETTGKLNVIGGGVTIMGYQTNTTTAFALVVWVSVPPKHYNAECALEVVLEDASGAPVALPTPTGQPQVMRIGQVVRFEEKLVPGIPRHEMPARTQLVVAFPTGLPIQVGQRYAWRVKLDDHTRDEWTETFFVPGAAPGPVLG